MPMAGCPGLLPTTEDLALKTYNDMRTIAEAVERYKRDHGALPAGDFHHARAALVLGGYIKNYPSPHPTIFAKKPMDYRVDPRYDKMDAGSTYDAAVVVWGLKDEFCREFNDRYSSDNSGPTIYDWEAKGKKYPGETIGRHMTTYAIKWESDAVDDCEVEWVVEYR